MVRLYKLKSLPKFNKNKDWNFHLWSASIPYLEFYIKRRVGFTPPPWQTLRVGTHVCGGGGEGGACYHAVHKQRTKDLGLLYPLTRSAPMDRKKERTNRQLAKRGAGACERSASLRLPYHAIPWNVETAEKPSFQTTLRIGIAVVDSSFNWRCKSWLHSYSWEQMLNIFQSCCFLSCPVYVGSNLFLLEPPLNLQIYRYIYPGKISPGQQGFEGDCVLKGSVTALPQAASLTGNVLLLQQLHPSQLQRRYFLKKNVYCGFVAHKDSFRYPPQTSIFTPHSTLIWRWTQAQLPPRSLAICISLM